MALSCRRDQANKVQADLLMVADPSYYLYLEDKGLLPAIMTPIKKLIAYGDIKLHN